MLGDTFVITHNAVVKTLKKVNQDNYGANYYLEDSANDMRFSVTVSHGIPKSGKTGESHFIRLDVEHYDTTTGALIRTNSSWTTIRTSTAVQDSVTAGYGADALYLWLTPANVALLLARES